MHLSTAAETLSVVLLLEQSVQKLLQELEVATESIMIAIPEVGPDQAADILTERSRLPSDLRLLDLRLLLPPNMSRTAMQTETRMAEAEAALEVSQDAVVVVVVRTILMTRMIIMRNVAEVLASTQTQSIAKQP
jgi:hypothetical protein